MQKNRSGEQGATLFLLLCHRQRFCFAVPSVHDARRTSEQKFTSAYRQPPLFAPHRIIVPHPLTPSQEGEHVRGSFHSPRCVRAFIPCRPSDTAIPFCPGIVNVEKEFNAGFSIKGLKNSDRGKGKNQCDHILKLKS